MGTGDLLGDLGERRIRRAGELESVFRHGDRVSAAMPFAHQPGARLQAETWIRSDSAFGPEHLRESLQRIRDKIAASKKKGMWMGDLPPLGYDVQNRKLVVNEEEAGTVPAIFRVRSAPFARDETVSVSRNGPRMRPFRRLSARYFWCLF